MISKKPNDHENDNNRDAKGPENGPPKSAVNRVFFWTTFTNGVVSRLAQTKNEPIKILFDVKRRCRTIDVTSNVAAETINRCDVRCHEQNKAECKESCYSRNILSWTDESPKPADIM